MRYAAGASACADERRQPTAGKAHAAGDSCGPSAVPEPDWFLSAVMPGGWGAPRSQLLHGQRPAAPSPAGLAGAGPAAGSAAGSQHAASCAAAAPGHERGAPSACPACERPFAALSPSQLAAGPPGAACTDLGSAAAPSAAARFAEERGCAPGPVPPMGSAEAEAALARAAAAGAAALLERGDALRACAALQDGLLQVRMHCDAAQSLMLQVVKKELGRTVAWVAKVCQACTLRKLTNSTLVPALPCKDINPDSCSLEVFCDHV